MNNQARKGAAAVALSSLACGLILSATALAQDRNSKPNQSAVETADTPDTGFVYTPPVEPAVASSGDEGGIAGTVAWDNGSMIPAPCSPASGCAAGGTRSILQDVSQGLNTFGFGASPTVVNTFVADDFTLASCTNLTTLEFYLYQTGAAAPSITSITVSLHSSLAVGDTPSSNVLQGPLTVASPVVTFEPIFRSLEATAGCTRQIQKVVVDVSAWPDLAAGTYWLSWQATGSVASGPWAPPVVECAGCGKPGANSLQASTNTVPSGSFAATTDTGGGPGCEGAPQDYPFVVRGTSCGGNPCPGNIVTSGSSATQVDIDDLLAVIAAWGPCPAPPASCPANIVTAGASATTVDIDDLLAVISAWGPCP